MSMNQSKFLNFIPAQKKLSERQKLVKKGTGKNWMNKKQKSA